MTNIKKKRGNLPLDKVASFWSIGGSIFAMFFGAGNTIFPLILGVQNHFHPIAAACGIIVTAVLVPFLGLLGIILYSGDYKKFFFEIGKIPGYGLIILILLLIGPLAGIPRAIAVSHSTLVSLNADLGLSLPLFSFICCLLIFAFSWKLSKLLQWLGYFFTPIMLGSLAWMLLKGFILKSTNPSVTIVPPAASLSFYDGIRVGFNTMDLIASFFFCSIVLTSLRQIANQSDTPLKGTSDLPIGKRTTILLMKGSLVTITLLAVIYFSFTTIAAKHAYAIQDVAPSGILGALSKLTLGKNGLITGVGVFAACLTTEIALAGIFSRFLQTTVFAKRNVSYHATLVLTLIPSFLISVLNFENICRLIGPLLSLCYPALIGLTIGNILHKLFNFKYSYMFFYGILLISICTKLFF
ncbi:MAG: branched-chain amino acid transport system II carrier protein [Victivallaceae bacterium]